VLKDNMDYSTGFADAEGKLVAQGLTLPGHLGSVPTALASIMKHYGDNMSPGDVFIMNDPFDGGMHLPDIFVFKPLYHANRRLAFAATVCHHTDVGGRVAGSNASDSTEIYAEGLRIAPLKLYDAGKLNDTIMTFIERNVRIPVKVFGDLRAQLAACHIAEQQFAELVAKHGPEQTMAFMRETIDYAERLTRAELEKLPDGEWSFEDWIDDDGIDYGKPIRLFVTLRKKGGHMLVDWTGTNPQVKGAINCVLSFTKSSVYACVRCLLPATLPNNEGYMRAIKVVAPAGTIVNPLPPAPVAARGLTGYRIANAVMGALAQVAPQSVPACESGGDTGISEYFASISAASSRCATKPGSTVNDGEELWQKLIARNSNVKLVFSGHDVNGSGLPPGTSALLTVICATLSGERLGRELRGAAGAGSAARAGSTSA